MHEVVLTVHFTLFPSSSTALRLYLFALFPLQEIALSTGTGTGSEQQQMETMKSPKALSGTNKGVQREWLRELAICQA